MYLERPLRVLAIGVSVRDILTTSFHKLQREASLDR